MKYLVLGSAGQIGPELCKHLKSEGHSVTEFDIVSNPSQDLRVQNILEHYIQETDFIMFLAFDVGGSRYLKKYQHTYEFIENNTKLTLFTFESIKKYNKPFIFASSQMANMSYSPYGVCKSLGEIFSTALGGVVIKAKNGKIVLMTDGKEERQFLHAEDCSRCLQILSEKYDQIDRSKNLHITNFGWNTILEVAEIIQESIPCEIQPSTEIDTVQLNKRNEPDPYILNFWEPKISLKEGINKIINDMK